MKMIQFRNFSFQYRAQAEPTLHHIDLTIQEGEKVLILGPSGSGKSTLAHCLNGLIPFYYPGKLEGSLALMGKELKETSIFELSRLVGTVLQDPDGQFVGLTVAEDIAFKLENEGVPQPEMKRRVAEAARMVDMEPHLHASPHMLSGGQKQRTALAGVMVSPVPILLFDEPLANLDPLTGQKAVELIDRIGRETGKTVIIIEHRLEEVLHRHVDRIIVMQEGRIAADLPAAELLSSELLRETGIREPLYITALKYAGCSITPDMRPEHPDSIRLESCADQLRAWHERHSAPQPPEPAAPILELQDVSFGYERGKLALQPLSLAVRQGEMLCIAGRNGAGKSTVSKLICGFHQPLAGRIMLHGRDMSAMTIKERSRHIGFVMQNPNHMLSKTMLYDEVALGLKVQGEPEGRMAERVHEALKICGLYEMRNWPVSALSFGQKKRATIASILVLGPEIIILDEPTAGQDFRHYNAMMEFLLELNRQGTTIIIITHDMHLMLEYATRSVVLSEGQKLADGPPGDSLADPFIANSANLKKTSVYRLAERAGIEEPQEFVRRFIAFDRRCRTQ
ncbi:ABC transporter ATP-binding protein [Paenibacillus protaetiae]|uniref:ABC transporter ATP-binding protein n=1 Tax=Paenibacillus protaetiae TaxID=2509456 RepID=A0A4P6EWH6_9BACL|nr:ABC transporter ATP-binding protein [Paenibacillus protaetiae]QAY66965.1 ABC transporter ATP-binding protein [Paenibacillus protaetiae]